MLVTLNPDDAQPITFFDGAPKIMSDAANAANTHITTEIGHIDLIRDEFIKAHPGKEMLVATRSYLINGTILDVADRAAKFMGAPIVSVDTSTQSITNDKMLVIVAMERVRHTSREWGDLDEGALLFEARVRNVSISVTGPREVIEPLFRLLDREIEIQRYATLRWWYRSETGGAESHFIHMPPVSTMLRPEFYPDLGDPQIFIKDYLASNSSVLLMAGNPGTGKTTLLRHMISDQKLTAHVIYDESLMSNDQIFQKFLFDNDSHLLIIEDADTILSPRDMEKNKLMARFLNVSDGLIKLPNKKIVFTTNLNDFSKVDHALLRPGRCYAVVHTRPLNLDEAKAAAKAAGIPIPVERGEYTIADLFNKNTINPNVRRIGFVK